MGRIASWNFVFMDIIVPLLQWALVEKTPFAVLLVVDLARRIIRLARSLSIRERRGGRRTTSDIKDLAWLVVTMP
jgi:hypothetical protein